MNITILVYTVLTSVWLDNVDSIHMKNMKTSYIAHILYRYLHIWTQVRLDNIDTYREVAHILALGSNYATTEKYIDGRYDLHLQKIGNNYRAYMWVISKEILAYLAITVSLQIKKIFKSWFLEPNFVWPTIVQNLFGDWLIWLKPTNFS